jgi:hypothetical protein
MYESLINISDRLTLSKEYLGSGLRGELIVGRNRITEEFIDPFGNKSYRSKLGEVLFRENNIIPIGAYQFVFNKLFNIGLDEETTLRVGDLNEEAPQMKIGIPKALYKSSSFNAEINGSQPGSAINAGVNISAMNFIFGFMCGDGGAKEDNVTAIATDYKRRTLFHAIPFRMSNDGTTIDQEKYFGKYQDLNGVTSYYVKRFDDPKPHIVHAWVTENGDESELVDDSVYASTSSIPIESYVEMNWSINNKDGKGYFTQSGTTPRINEIGLVTGWYNNEIRDYESLRLFTHFTRSSIILDEGDEIEAIYRLYAR